MTADVAPQKIEAHFILVRIRQDTRDGAAYIDCGVNQSAIEIEQVNVERWDYQTRSRRLRTLSSHQPRNRVSGWVRSNDGTAFGRSRSLRAGNLFRQRLAVNQV